MCVVACELICRPLAGMGGEWAHISPYRCVVGIRGRCDRERGTTRKLAVECDLHTETQPVNTYLSGSWSSMMGALGETTWSGSCYVMVSRGRDVLSHQSGIDLQEHVARSSE